MVQLFTGFPCERIELYVRSEIVAKRQERRQRRIDERTQRLMRGETMDDADDMDDDDPNDDMLWSKMLSYKEAGCACLPLTLPLTLPASHSASPSINAHASCGLLCVIAGTSWGWGARKRAAKRLKRRL